MSPAKRARAVSHSKPAPKKAAAKRTRAKASDSNVGSITFRTPTRTFQFNVDPARAAAVDKQFQKEAMRWTYVLRNRERWTDLPDSAAFQTNRARDLLKGLGLQEGDFETIANDGVVEVSFPYEREDRGWEARIFPWEFILAGATRKERHGKALTVTRQLESADAHGVTKPPVRVLYVESAPGLLRDLYSFDSEQSLCRLNLRPSPPNWRMLQTPTLKQLQDTVTTFKPDVVHLAGFDSHQGLRLLAEQRQGRSDDQTQEAIERAREVADGYLMASQNGDAEPVAADQLAKALCSDKHRPALVSFSLQNSAARIAPLVVARGAGAAIGFQDVFDEVLVERFFGTFYRTWRRSKWDLLDAFRTGWESVRGQPSSTRGSGLVLWSARQLVLARTRAKTRRAAAPVAETVWMPGHVPDADALTVLPLKIKTCTEANYSLLHNGGSLFVDFTIGNASAAYKNSDQVATIADVDISVALNTGTAESATYKRRVRVDEKGFDVNQYIRLPLTADLLRSVHESINSSLLVEVKWGNTIHCDTYPVRLLPVDQWRDNDNDGKWLPSFVLPRDAAVMSLIDKAQRYVRVLRDDPSAGFDGYQSIDRAASDQSRDVDLQVQAIWSTIVHELNLGYINPPPSYNTAMDAQRLRTPSMICETRSGTCLDLAVLMAACCELIDVYPVIFLLKDHAFPGYWRQDTFQRDFMKIADDVSEDMATEGQQRTTVPGAQSVPWWLRESAFPEILREVKRGRLVPLESVWLTEHSGFWDAVEGGKGYLKDTIRARKRFHSMLDIARAREKGVTPLPISVRL